MPLPLLPLHPSCLPSTLTPQGPALAVTSTYSASLTSLPSKILLSLKTQPKVHPSPGASPSLPVGLTPSFGSEDMASGPLERYQSFLCPLPHCCWLLTACSYLASLTSLLLGLPFSLGPRARPGPHSFSASNLQRREATEPLCCSCRICEMGAARVPPL